VSFRSDHDALLAQAEALRRDLADAEARLAAASDDDDELAALRAQVDRLRAENEKLRAEVEGPAEPQPPSEAPPRPEPIPHQVPRVEPAGTGSLLRPLIDTTPKAKPDRTGFLYVAFIALVLAGFIALGLSFL
jgi:hypothetical protein